MLARMCSEACFEFQTLVSAFVASVVPARMDDRPAEQTAITSQEDNC